MDDDGVVYDPPERYVRLSAAILDIYKPSGRGEQADTEIAHIDLPAKSLLYALQVAINDDVLSSDERA